MENKRLIVLFASCFSILFSMIYYCLFTLNLSKADVEERTLYMNQVGLYQKEASVHSMMETLEKAGLRAFQLKQGDLTAVVCSVSTNKENAVKDQSKLKELKLSYIAKSVLVEDENIVTLIDQQQYDKALERIGK